MDANNYANPTYAYVGAFVEELERSGLHNVVICPGSRSTPLAMVFVSARNIRTWMHIDERSAAFFALGMAKRLNEPVALVCTSGTAAANFLPAIVESKLTHVSLLVLTADRPPELREVGAPQAIDQIRLYGSHVKWFMDVALPEATNEAMRYIRSLACRAVALTRSTPAGPVHLNMPFREPLTPDAIPGQPLPPVEQRDPVARGERGYWSSAQYTWVTSSAPQQTSSESPFAVNTGSLLAFYIDRAPRGLIIVGPEPQVDPYLHKALVDLSAKTGYPILADPLSQLRDTNKHNRILTSYDAFLRSSFFVENTKPEFILRIGPMLTSKPLLLYLQRYADCPHIVIDKHGGWEDPTHLVTGFLHADPTIVCKDILKTFSQSANSEFRKDFHFPPMFQGLDAYQEQRQSWLQRWQSVDKIACRALESAINNFEQPFEGRVFTELAHILPKQTNLYVGNSMPVRDMDTFFWPDNEYMEDGIRCLGNRGANGIDGLVSSALGVSAAYSSPILSYDEDGTEHIHPGSIYSTNERTVLVIGDLSFYHDLNGLLAAKLHKLQLTIILVNNDGGGIFSFLPQAAHPEHFEQLFGTPTGLDFRPVVEMYGGTFHRPANWEEFREMVTESFKGGLHVIEIRTDREQNVAMHRQLWQVVDKALQEAL